ncbi:MCE family protein [Chryseobacterium joostei]|uniref:MCE family protein n=2 Tax=Pseudomonadati TaxID=3379134 RepID=A0A1N7HSH3_9FLAO|nr:MULTISPECIES: MlaD family protein [Chryseobacterium]AZA77107.1 MCE family protein [Chryseobacterium sp. G0186]AZA99293.1 MCE family protein [Chryseobacterium joostei]SIS27698.1 phospholipid/cholesterol/gamma-HCH transport system substrate-binding protein [Chryseobacterium joostei]
MNNESSNNWKLGIFVTAGILLFIATIYFIGVNRNLFGSNFVLRSEFKNVSGLKQGSNVRLSGINIGTVSKINFISDSLVLVKLLIRKDVQKYIKTDAVASIASDGLMGDKILIITPGPQSNTIVKDNDFITSYKTIEIDDILSSVKQSTDNAEAITDELVEFSSKMNNKNSLLTKIMTNKDFASRIDKTIENLQLSSRELAKFTSLMNNKNGFASKIFTDKKWSDNIESSISNLRNSSQEISRFTTKLNDKNNVFSQLSSNDSLALSIEKTLHNLEKSSDDLIQFTSKINNDENVLSKLTNNPKLGKSVDSTIINIEKGVGELREIEAAAKNNFLLRGYFNKKRKENEKQKR